MTNHSSDAQTKRVWTLKMLNLTYRFHLLCDKRKALILPVICLRKFRHIHIILTHHLHHVLMNSNNTRSISAWPIIWPVASCLRHISGFHENPIKHCTISNDEFKRRVKVNQSTAVQQLFNRIVNSKYFNNSKDTLNKPFAKGPVKTLKTDKSCPYLNSGKFESDKIALAKQIAKNNI